MSQFHIIVAATRQSAAIVLSLVVACLLAEDCLQPAMHAAEAKGQRVFRAGAAASNITPLLGVRLDGTIMQIGPAKGVHDELHARCLALDDGSTRLAIVVCDVTMIDRSVFEKARRLAHEQTGLPPDRLLMSATHTHSTPRAVDIGQGKLNEEYHDFLAVRIADGVRRAINNLAPAKIGWGRGSKPEFLHNRRWFVKPESISPNPFGEKGDQVVMNPPRGALLKPAGPVDPEVFVLSLQRADGRPLAVLANYGLHYVGGIPGGQISADYFGAFADRLQELLGADRQDPPFVGIMSNGTSGDVNANDFSQPPVKKPAYAQMREVADGVAQEVVRVCRQIQHHDWVPLAMREIDLQLAVRRPDEKRLAWAKGIAAKASGKERLTRPEVYARETLALAKYPPTLPVKLQAIRLGDLAIGAAPCEVFAETGLAIKQQSPFKSTFIIELANGFNGYLPTPQQHEWGGYETWMARSACLEVQAEPKIRAGLLRLMNELAKEER